MIGIDCTGSCNSNYHTITTTTAPFCVVRLFINSHIFSLGYYRVGPSGWRDFDLFIVPLSKLYPVSFGNISGSLDLTERPLKPQNWKPV
jgi:hypothetical protein